MEFIKKIGKSERGSVTVYVLSTLIVVLLVTTTIYIGLRNKTTTQIKQMDKINKEYSVTDDDMQEAYNNNSVIIKTLKSVKGTETTNTIVKDNLGNQVVVPAGFKVVNPDDNVTDGIIIEDISHSATAGSQFVWIPVGDIIKDSEGNKETIKLSRYTFSSDGTSTDQGSKTIENCWTEDTASNHNSSYGNTIAKDIEDFKSKATTNHGYYIGRYEARKNGTQVTVKASDTVYNNITQPNAATVSRGMYSSDSNFESDLMNSYAWDTAVYFLQTFDNRDNKTSLKPYSRQNSLNTSPASQGTNNVSDASKQDVICNVWDMASNCYEWTTETYSDSVLPCTYRGGYYHSSSYYTSSRISHNTAYSSLVISFRSLLYM